MYKLTLLLIPLILLSSCTIDWNNEKDKKITELEKQVTELKGKNDDELFKNKQKCLEIYIKFDPTNVLGRRDLFYSTRESTCIVLGDYWHKDERIFGLFDILSQKSLYGMSVDKNWKVIGRNNLKGELNELKCGFNEAISKLKGEDSIYFNSAKDCTDGNIN